MKEGETPSNIDAMLIDENAALRKLVADCEEKTTMYMAAVSCLAILNSSFIVQHSVCLSPSMTVALPYNVV